MSTAAAKKQQTAFVTTLHADLAALLFQVEGNVMSGLCKSVCARSFDTAPQASRGQHTLQRPSPSMAEAHAWFPPGTYESVKSSHISSLPFRQRAVLATHSTNSVIGVFAASW